MRAKFPTQAEIQDRIRTAIANGQHVVAIAPNCDIITRPRTEAEAVSLVSNPRWLTKPQAAERVGLTPKDFGLLVKEGIFPPAGINKLWDRKTLVGYQELAMIPNKSLADTYVYFMEMGKFIKIGISGSPEVRKNALQTSSPYDIAILFAVQGSEDNERDLHRAFRKQHHRGEWFHGSESLRIYIRWLAQVMPRERVWRW